MSIVDCRTDPFIVDCRTDPFNGAPAQQASAHAPPTSQGANGKGSTLAPADHGTQPTDESAANTQEAGQPTTTRDHVAGQPPIRTSGSPPSSLSQRQPAMPLPIRLEKGLSYLLLAIVLIIFAPRFWPLVCTLFKSLLSLLAGLFGGSSTRSAKSRPKHGSAPLESKAQPVRLLANPFHTGQADRMTLPELIQYSFEGLTVWAQSRGFHLDESETVLEFAERLSQKEPVLTHEILRLSSYYSHVTYGNQTPSEDSRDVLKSLWFTIGFESKSPQAGSR